MTHGHLGSLKDGTLQHGSPEMAVESLLDGSLQGLFHAVEVLASHPSTWSICGFPEVK